MYLNVFNQKMWWGPTKAVFHSVRLYPVIIILGGDGDTLPLFSQN